MTTVTMRRVGGCVRDELMGLRSKDVDFSVELPEMVGRPASEGFAAMLAHLAGEGFEVFEERPEFLTIRARFPRAHELHARQTADFVLCRREGAYSDGRRPDSVTVGTLADDLARRDFTVNAIAEELDGSLVDPHGGRRDLELGVLRAVGSAEERLSEDALRALRALRFWVTKSLVPDAELQVALRSEWRRDELARCMQASTLATLDALHELPTSFRDAALEGLKLFPTQRDRLPHD
jgi:tRNA nucleotidyltransferase (CCA-adding enzyme)